MKTFSTTGAPELMNNITETHRRDSGDIIWEAILDIR